LNLVFKDNGHGISPDHLPKVFDIFYTSQPTIKNGMGLTLCKKICELHGGKIGINSVQKEGTELLVELLDLKEIYAELWVIFQCYR